MLILSLFLGTFFFSNEGYRDKKLLQPIKAQVMATKKVSSLLLSLVVVFALICMPTISGDIFICYIVLKAKIKTYFSIRSSLIKNQAICESKSIIRRKKFCLHSFCNLHTHYWYSEILPAHWVKDIHTF